MSGRDPNHTRLLTLAAGLLLSVAGHAASAPKPLEQGWASAMDRGWLEAIVSVSDAAAMRQFATEVAGWRQWHTGAVGSRQLEFYSARPSRNKAPREWLIADATASPGYLRLLQFNDSRAVAIRSGANPWDTGGILSLMTRSNQTPEVYRRAQRLGWNAFNDPSELFLPESGVRLTNVILRGPDAISISVYERLTPRMPADSDLEQLRRPFNSMQSVRDIETARRFYAEVLGFEIVNTGNFVNPIRAPNNFGTPANLVVASPLPFAILGPSKDGPTQIELIQMPGVEGRDLAQRAVPPNLGLLGLRFPVSDLGKILARLESHRWPIARRPSRLSIAPWGEVEILAVQAPDGAWLEFLQRIST